MLKKSSLQSQVNKLNRLNNELKQQVSLSNRTSDDKSSKPEEKYGEEHKKEGEEGINGNWDLPYF